MKTKTAIRKKRRENIPGSNRQQKYFAWLTSNPSIFLVICSCSTFHLFFLVDTQKLCKRETSILYLHLILTICWRQWRWRRRWWWQLLLLHIRFQAARYYADQSIANWLFPNGYDFDFHARFKWLGHNANQPICTSERGFVANFIYLFADETNRQSGGKTTRVWIIGWWWWVCLCA